MDSTARLDLLNASMDEQDTLRKKLAMDALKQRLGGQPDADKKLREACEGFESIFIGKLWQQMRQTVPKEGYLHSKEEDMYLSMFDTELAKKMADAGGIGLGDMLYRQLKESTAQASRTAAPSRMANPLPVAELARPARIPQPEQPGLAAIEESAAEPDLLYTPLDGYGAVAVNQPSRSAPPTEEVLAQVDTLARMIVEREPGRAVSTGGPVQPVSAFQASLPLLNDLSPKEGGQPSSLYWPVAGEISSDFGWRADPLTNGKQWHSGVDIAGVEGEPVASCWDGQVIFADENREYGKLLIVEHDG